MKTLKILFIIAITSSFMQCKTMKLTDNPPFKITGTTYNNWVGGQPGVSGIKVIIGVESNKEVTFDKMYFYNKITTLQKRTVKNKEYLIGHINTSTRNNLDIVIENPLENKKLTNSKKEIFPFILQENEVVISYKKENKVFYYKISNIKRTKTDFYP